MQCFGNALFWALYINSDGILLEAHEHFQKTGYRNRYHVLGSHGVILLSIPVSGGRETRELITKVRIDNSKRWKEQHWRTLTSCYHKSPYFFYYADDLKGLFFESGDLLWERNLSFFIWTRKKLKISLPYQYTSSFQSEYREEEILDYRGRMKAGKRENQLLPRYQQVFGSVFQPNLSILDILFNLGPESLSYLSSIKTF